VSRLASSGGTGGDAFADLTSATIASFPRRLPMTSSPTFLDFTTDGATMTFHSSGGWNDQGYVRFRSPTDGVGESYAALGSVNFPAGTSQVNIGYLWREAVQLSNNPKMCIINTSPTDDPRPMVLRHDCATEQAGGHADQFCYICSNNVEPHYSDWGGPGDHPAGGFSLNPYTYPTPDTDFRNTWVYFEFEVRRSPGNLKLYVTTDNGQFNEHVIKSDPSGVGSGETLTSMQILGSYGWNNASQTESLDIGRVYFSTSYIGPPSGFAS
jgi:hypothetical protein